MTKTSFWHGFTNMNQLNRRCAPMSEASGAWVTDDSGKRYLNAISSLINLNLGAGRTEIIEAMTAQARRLPYFPIEGGSHEIAEEYARRLCRVTPAGLDTVFYATTGAEANEWIFKLMRQYQRLRHGPETGKIQILSLDRGYHGMTYGALSATGSCYRRWRAPYEPLPAGFHHLPTPDRYRCALGCAGRCDLRCADAVEQTVTRLGPENVAGIVLEPVLCAGGVIVPDAGYHQRVRELCDRHDILLAYDEVVTGFGRLGSWFGADHFGVVPDFMALAKGINSGYLPFGAVVVRDRIYQEFLDATEGYVAIGSTTNGNPICAASALATLDIIEKEGLVGRARESGEHLFRRLARLSDIPIVGDVRGAGLLAAVELVRDRDTREPLPPAMWHLVQDRIVANGLIVGCFGESALATTVCLAPPLTIEPAELDELADRLDTTLRRCATLPARG
jgi:adenosylmethionine-8-amino-7-oxononanoate aminotransferase